MWIDSGAHQTAVFPVLSDSFWAMKRGWCHLGHLWVEAWEAQVWFSSLSLFCPRSCMFQRVHMEESHWPLTTVGCDECVCVCIWVCVYVCICLCVCVCMCVCVRFGGHFFQQQSRVSSDGYKGERRLEKKTESVTWSRYFPGSPLPSVSSSQTAPSDPTLLPLLGLVVSQSPFLIDQQLDLSPV